ncbi:hypothetical protein [Mycolicibacter sinensis]|uniref:hypothetical protein n=1 Tax=Mycolicibacter sinensis (strain JDM601) TaxID=875328 RepID=UPI000A55843B|nr:hypothetical protein [Mycolicibacter sinensis]
MSKDYVREFWTVNTKRGARAYYYSTLARRALPLSIADAELLEATGKARRIERPTGAGGG